MSLNIFPSVNVLSQEAHVVRDLCIIISINCILSGIFFILYVIKRDIIHGRVFVALFFVIDTVFEIAYVCFPLIYLTVVGDSIFDLVSLGTLREENFFIFIQSLWITILLTIKCDKLSKELDPAQIVHNYWKPVLKTPWIDHHKIRIHKSQSKQKVVVLSRSPTLSSTVGRHESVRGQVEETTGNIEHIAKALDTKNPSIGSENNDIPDLYKEHDDEFALSAIEMVDNEMTQMQQTIAKGPQLISASSFTITTMLVTNAMSIASLSDKQILYNMIVHVIVDYLYFQK